MFHAFLLNTYWRLKVIFKQLWIQMKTDKWFFMRYLLSAIWRPYFHPAKSDYKTVSVAQSKNLLNWKPASLTNYELLLRVVILCFLGQKSFFFEYCIVRTKKFHKKNLKKIDLSSLRTLNYLLSKFPDLRRLYSGLQLST